MLVHWQSHQEYLNFLHETKVHLDSSQRTRLHFEFGSVRKKLRLLDLDPVMEYLSAFYSPIGRPAKNQVQIIRSLILMLMLGFTSLAAILPSRGDRLIPADGLTLSGDGTCVHSHASPYGHKVCKCVENGTAHYSCKRHFSDPDAHWGWDSDEETFYFGHTLYMLCFHNAKIGIGLPLHIRFLDARRHDSVSAIVSLREFKTINPDIPVKNLCLDSAHDNYATYGLCQKWKLRPFIDLNSNRGRPDSIPGFLSIDDDGTPLCMAGFRMVNWGYCKQKHSRKWRCPLACGKTDSCSCREKCSPSPMAAASIPSPAGISASIRLFQEGQRNIRRSTRTVLPAKG